MFGLIFDVDGVIADTEPINARATIKVFTDLFGIHHVRRADFDAGLGRGAEQYVAAAATVHALSLTAQQLTEAVSLRERNILDLIRREGLDAFPGVLSLMNAALGRQDFCVGIASSACRDLVQSILECTGVPYDRMVRITGDQVRRKKPDPQLFLLAAAAMDVSPQHCVVIEDAPNGVEAANRAGCRCIAVTNSTSAANLAGADMIVANLETVTVDALIKLISVPHKIK
jgi:HAD superfamily hydrolase (TIGR01509 family)